MDNLKKEIAHIKNQKTKYPISMFMCLKEINDKNLVSAVNKAVAK